jgi:hypothetical protein
MMGKGKGKKAVGLLKKYDRLRRELEQVERELTLACTEYGLEMGRRGFSPVHLRGLVNMVERAGV